MKNDIENNVITFNQILEEFNISALKEDVIKELGVTETSTFDEIHLIAVDYLVEKHSKDVYSPAI